MDNIALILAALTLADSFKQQISDHKKEFDIYNQLITLIEQKFQGKPDAQLVLRRLTEIT